MINHNWILAVLDDIREYAKLNGLPEIEKTMQETNSVAKVEIDATKPKKAAVTNKGENSIRFDGLKH